MRAFTLVLLAGLAAVAAAEYDCAADPLSARLSAALSDCREAARASAAQPGGFFRRLVRPNLNGFPLVCSGAALNLVSIHRWSRKAVISQSGLGAFAESVGLGEALAGCKADCAPPARRPARGFFWRARRLVTEVASHVWSRRGYPDVEGDVGCFVGCLNRARDAACAAAAEPVAEEFETEVELEEQKEELDLLVQMDQDVQADNLSPDDTQAIKDALQAEVQEEEHQVQNGIEQEEATGEYEFVETSGKWYDFASEDVGDKSVGAIKGIGSTTKQVMEERGWTDASQLLYKLLSLGEDNQAAFDKWLEEEFYKPAEVEGKRDFKIRSDWRDTIYRNLKDFLGWCRFEKENYPEKELCTFDEAAVDEVELPADVLYQAEPLAAAGAA